ncbi:MAG: hypothetical protein R3F14_09510 [Polyangiaceae bacterium]
MLVDAPLPREGVDGGVRRDDEAHVGAGGDGDVALHVGGQRVRIEQDERASAGGRERGRRQVAPARHIVQLAAPDAGHEDEGPVASRGGEVRDGGPRDGVEAGGDQERRGAAGLPDAFERFERDAGRRAVGGDAGGARGISATARRRPAW